jgi:hypothetical protein
MTSVRVGVGISTRQLAAKMGMIRQDGGRTKGANGGVEMLVGHDSRRSVNRIFVQTENVELEEKRGLLIDVLFFSRVRGGWHRDRVSQGGQGDRTCSKRWEHKL